MMRILKINIESFLGIRNASLEFDGINIVAGNNWAGKSSIQQALRITTSGEVARVKLKGEYGLLVTDGAKKAELTAFFDDGTFNLVSIPTTGKATIPNCDSEMLRIVLDQERFMSLDENAMRKVIMQASPQIFDGQKVIKRILELGADEQVVEAVLPLLKDGFDVAESEADQQLKNFRAKWKAITNETYGSEKAANWEASNDVEGLLKKAQGYAKLQDDLNDVDDKIIAHQRIVDAARTDVLKYSLDYTCANCEHVHTHDPEAAEKYKQIYAKERATLDFLQNSRIGIAAELKAADEAANAVEQAKKDAADNTAQAGEIHEVIQKWAKLKELLSPSGVMAELIAEAIKPINQQLQQSAEISGLGLVQITHDMQVTLNNRLYGLCSESQQWIAQAMLCEALSHVAKLDMVVLDRIDVLSVENRGNLIKWCKAMNAAKHTQFILFGTLKSKPELAGIKSFWVEDGKVS